MSGRRRQHRGRAARPVGAGTWLLLALAAILLTGAALLVLHVRSYLTGSQQRAHALVTTEKTRISKAHAAPRCVAPPPSRTQAPLRGLLNIPALGLNAPVQEGVANASLDAGVGHVPSSSWPDQGGTSILAAHDVTFFARIDRLPPGAEIVFSGDCEQWTYRVTGSEIVQQGTPVAQVIGNQLTLVTCYPTNALFFTNQRYLVNASLVGVTRSQPARTIPNLPLAPTYTAPPALAAQGLTLQTNYVPLAGLTLDPGFDPAWIQSDRPLTDANAAISTLIAVKKTLEQDRPDFWTALAPLVPFDTVAALAGKPARYTTAASVHIHGRGERVDSIDITCGLQVDGSAYALGLILQSVAGHTVISAVVLL